MFKKLKEWRMRRRVRKFLRNMQKAQSMLGEVRRLPRRERRAIWRNQWNSLKRQGG